MNASAIIAIVGMPGAGKSEAASFFRHRGLPVLRFGQITDEGVQQAGLELTEENERVVRERLRAKLGMKAYAVKMYPKIKEAFIKNELVVLDGLYSWEEYIYLKEKYTNLVLLCIYARPEIRYKRLVHRNHRRRSMDIARKRDIAELVKLNKGSPIALADYLIMNEQNLPELHKKLNIFLRLVESHEIKTYG